MTQIKVTYLDHCGSDLTTVNAARVSFGKESEWEYCCGEYCGDLCEEDDTQCPKLSDRDTKLIHYLAKHKHLSPFGHAFASFHVKAPIFVARQLVKHKFLRWNEVSRRYTDDEPEFFVPENWREKSDDKKQGSGDGFVNTLPQDDFDDYAEDKAYLGSSWDTDTTQYVKDNTYFRAMCIYKELLDAGVAPEQARMVLPQSTMTECYLSGSLDSFAAMCKLRCASDTQYESRIVAEQISAKMGELFPVSWAALMKGEK
jgi:thymidylate synthase (FAD)